MQPRQDLVEYIRQQLQQGYAPPAIRNQLLQSGWPPADIDNAFGQPQFNQAPAPMPTQQSPHAQPRKRNRSALKWVLGIVGVIVLLIIALPFLLGSLASPALQKTTDNTSRENDISKIAAALITYISNNQNVLPASTAADATPGTLDICGSDCSVTQKQPVTLGYYAATPAAVSFRAYANNLAVPDAKTVYIVTNATCKDDKSGIGDSSADNQSLVILYAIQSGNGIKQQCLNPY